MRVLQPPFHSLFLVKLNPAASDPMIQQERESYLSAFQGSLVNTVREIQSSWVVVFSQVLLKL